MLSPTASLHDDSDESSLVRPRWTTRRGLLEIDTDYDGQRRRLSLRGELDLSNVELLEGELRLAEVSDAASVVVDLTLLEFVDSSGVHALLHAQERLRRNGARLSVVPGSRRVQSTFRLTETEQHLPFVGSPAEADRPPSTR